MLGHRWNTDSERHAHLPRLDLLVTYSKPCKCQTTFPGGTSGNEKSEPYERTTAIHGFHHVPSQDGTHELVPSVMELCRNMEKFSKSNLRDLVVTCAVYQRLEVGPYTMSAPSCSFAERSTALNGPGYYRRSPVVPRCGPTPRVPTCSLARRNSMKNFKVQSSELMVTSAVCQRLDWAQQLESAPSCSLTERNIMKNSSPSKSSPKDSHLLPPLTRAQNNPS